MLLIMLTMYSIAINCERALQCKFERRSQMFFKIDVLKNFANFTGKHLCWSLFLIQLQAWRVATLFKKRLQHSCFPVKFAKFFRTPFFNKPFPVVPCELHAMSVFGEGVHFSLSFSMEEVVAEACSSKVRCCNATQPHLFWKTEWQILVLFTSSVECESCWVECLRCLEREGLGWSHFSN